MGGDTAPSPDDRVGIEQALVSYLRHIRSPCVCVRPESRMSSWPCTSTSRPNP